MTADDLSFREALGARLQDVSDMFTQVFDAVINAYEADGSPFGPSCDWANVASWLALKDAQFDAIEQAEHLMNVARENVRCVTCADLIDWEAPRDRFGAVHFSGHDFCSIHCAMLLRRSNRPG